ncbi:MAG TPA: hypothetical protein VNZ03_35935 [Terriglobales bacterium]|nr:hypothetical protein [Terriglobales bacterium]
MRKLAVSVLSMFCLFTGLAISAGTALAQSPTPNKVTLTPKNLSFSVSAGKSATAETVLRNQSGALLQITKIEIVGICANPSNCAVPFHVVSHSCGATLKNGESCKLNVEFAPDAIVETAHASLRVAFDTAILGQSRSVVLTGVSRN